MCVSWGDPHFKTFFGKKFDNYQLGDYVLTKSNQLKITVRQRRWGGASVNVLFVAKINGVLVEANRPEYFTLNKKERINLKVGQSVQLQNGGKVERVEADRWFVISRKGGYVDVKFFYYGGALKVGNQQYQRRYMNFVIKVPHPKKTTGFCVGKTIKSSKDFSRAYKSKNGTLIIKAISKKCKRSARLRCLNQHVQRSDLRNCISDVCRGFRAKNVRKFEKNARHDARRWNKVFRKTALRRLAKKYLQKKECYTFNLFHQKENTIKKK